MSVAIKMVSGNNPKVDYGSREWWLEQAGTPAAPRQILFTPALAQSFLANFCPNRRAGDVHVAALMSFLRRGEWVESTTVSVNHQGVGNNGYHRMRAVIATGIPARMHLVVMSDEEVAVMDTVVRARSIPDALMMQGRGVAGGNQAVAMARLWGRIEAGTVAAKRGPIVATECEEAWAKFPTILEVSARKFHFCDKVFRVTPYMTVLAMALHYSREAGMDFARGVKDGAGLAVGDPRLTLRNRWLNRTAGDSEARRTAFAVKAWNAYAVGRPLGVLKWLDGEPFPSFHRGVA